MRDRLTRHNGILEHGQLCNCLDCRTAWEEWHEAKYAWRQAQEAELRQAKPATDEEWVAFFDAECPRVKEGVA